MAAEIPNGAVLVARAIINSSLWTMRPADCKVAITCIALCNKSDEKWFDGEREITIHRGSFVRSWGNFVKSCALPLQVVRTSVDHLKSTDFLTRKSIKAYTLFTIPKYEHYQDLTKYSDSVMLKANTVSNTRLTTNNNNIREDREKSSSGQGGGRGDAVVVRKESGDPILEKVSFRISTDLLSELKLNQACTNAFAATKPVGQVLKVVQQARLQRKPAAWARVALENDWMMPEATGLELDEVIEKVKADVERANAHFLRKTTGAGVKVIPERRENEDERSYLTRVSNELKRRKEGQKPAGSEEGR